jgi:RNA-directed DNA polymerase
LQKRSPESALGAIYEQDFLECSFGYRVGRNPHWALKALRDHIGTGKVRHRYEADIQGYFTNLTPKWLRRRISRRIADPVISGLIGKGLKAGVREHGVVARPEAGTPQGGPISPCLAFVKLGRGKAYLVRYWDDFIACFEDEEDAKRVRYERRGRWAAFGLEVEPTKRGVLRFGSQAEQECHKDGPCRPETFNFLGFTHFVGHSRQGRFIVGHKTQGKRFRKKLKGLNQRLGARRVAGGKAMLEYFQHPIRGHLLDSGVSGNIRWVTS